MEKNELNAKPTQEINPWVGKKNCYEKEKLSLLRRSDNSNIYKII